MNMEDIVGNIQGVVLLDNEGNRIFAKYFNMNFQNVEQEKEFELKLYKKAGKQSHNRMSSESTY